MKKVNWLKVTGIAILIQIILIALVFLTVFVYSMAINTGQTEAFYEAFAEKAAPYVATIGGAILMYWFVQKLTRGRDVNPFIIGFGLPGIYILLDLLFIVATSADTKAIMTIAASNIIKLAAGVLSAYRVQQARVYAKPGTDDDL